VNPARNFDANADVCVSCCCKTSQLPHAIPVIHNTLNVSCLLPPLQQSRELLERLKRMDAFDTQNFDCTVCPHCFSLANGHAVMKTC
jgi:hypothetical protein